MEIVTASLLSLLFKFVTVSNHIISANPSSGHKKHKKGHKDKDKDKEKGKHHESKNKKKKKH